MSAILEEESSDLDEFHLNSDYIGPFMQSKDGKNLRMPKLRGESTQTQLREYQKIDKTFFDMQN